MTKEQWDSMSYEQWLEWRACKSKKYCFTEEPIKTTRFVSYKCKYCSGWHLTARTLLRAEAA